MSVNLTKNQEEITRAWRTVVDSKNTENWALFGYEGNTNVIKLISTGIGLKSLVREFNCSLIQYAFCRVLNEELCINKLVLINWQGDSSPLSRKGLCASHLGDVSNYFKGCSQTITIRNEDEATEEYLIDLIAKTSSLRVNYRSSKEQTDTATANKPPNVDSSYKKIQVNTEISSVDRKSFWQKQEEEERERLVEEKKRAAEKQAQFERERKLREEAEAKKLAEAIKERDRIIDAARQPKRREPSGSSQPSSILSVNDIQDDDERVGRRSELIRLERNQETQSLISKGLIRNKRAIFEQASLEQQKQSQPSLGGEMKRRSSGTMIAQRLNTLKSLESNCSSASSSSSKTSIEKLTNGFAKQINIDGDANTNGTIIRREIESFQIMPDVQLDNVAPPQIDPSDKYLANNGRVEALEQSRSSIDDASAAGNGETRTTNGDKNHVSPQRSEEKDVNGDIRAKALYDYQAGDSTEISFDPDDLIGFIEKVDAGWWHGTVLNGKYKGQMGLFPANYVEEL